uniref:Cytochrome P450 CYP427A1 n=1 Tax=Nilaparvata lugens TaxID=108931 RepID=A0A0K0LBB4_NILLU|nr:cytochrome P450 CYP427A1 [Nilaparvata lugens]
MDSGNPILICIGLLISFLITVAYVYCEWLYGYWKRKNVPHEKATSIIYGSIRKIFKAEESQGIFFKDIYDSFPGEPFVGFYEFQRPSLLLRDPEVVKKVLTENFNSFHKNGVYTNEKEDSFFSRNPFVLAGAEWKEARSKLTQALTVNKLKFIPESVSKMYPSMKTFLDEANDNIEAYELGTNITSGMAASWSWGIEDSGFTKTKSYVREIAQKFVDVFIGTDSSMQLIHINPWFTPLFRPTIVSQENGFFNDLTAKSLKMLISTGNRNSPCILNSLRQTRLKSGQTDDDLMKNDAIKDLSGVVASFYLDAYETTARAMSFLFYTLAQYPDVQSRLREEVKKLPKEQITLEEVQKLPYLDMVFSEVLRMYPPATFLRKKCTQDCELSGVKVEAGSHIILPILALHMDGDIYADPEKFEPERFSEENKNDRHPYAYIPFGSGPRMCPGMRFAISLIKVITSFLLQDYEILPPKNEELKPIKPSVSGVLLVPDAPLKLHIAKLNK